MTALITIKGLDMGQEGSFFCCNEPRVAILKCPHCKNLAGCCRNCRKLFYNLNNLTLAFVINLGAGFNCSNCSFNFLPTLDWNHYIANRRDITLAQCEHLLSAEVELSEERPAAFSEERVRRAVNALRWPIFNYQPGRTSFIVWFADYFYIFLLIFLFCAAFKLFKIYYDNYMLQFY